MARTVITGEETAGMPDVGLALDRAVSSLWAVSAQLSSGMAHPSSVVADRAPAPAPVPSAGEALAGQGSVWVAVLSCSGAY